MERPQVRPLLLVQCAQGAWALQGRRDQGLHAGAARRCSEGTFMLIQQKWLALPEDQRGSLKAYIIDNILQLSAIDNLSKTMHNILSKCNSILVQIVKYEWKTSWVTFINDICESSMKNMNICENNFYILKMLSEEIFDHSKNQMTQSQILELKNQMNADFTTIF